MLKYFMKHFREIVSPEADLLEVVVEYGDPPTVQCPRDWLNVLALFAGKR